MTWCGINWSTLTLSPCVSQVFVPRGKGSVGWGLAGVKGEQAKHNSAHQTCELSCLFLHFVLLSNHHLLWPKMISVNWIEVFCPVFPFSFWHGKWKSHCLPKLNTYEGRLGQATQQVLATIFRLDVPESTKSLITLRERKRLPALGPDVGELQTTVKTVQLVQDTQALQGSPVACSEACVTDLAPVLTACRLWRIGAVGCG